MKKTGLDIDDKLFDLSTDVASLLHVPDVEGSLGPVLVYELGRLDALLMDYFEAEACE